MAVLSQRQNLDQQTPRTGGRETGPFAYAGTDRSFSARGCLSEKAQGMVYKGRILFDSGCVSSH